MVLNNVIPIKPNPILLDKILGNIQTGLMDGLLWLDVAFGKAERLVKVVNNKRYYTPNVYAGGTPWIKGNNDYLELSPDSNIGNYSFFWLPDPQNIAWTPNLPVSINTRFALIFWFDLQRIYSNINNRNTEALKNEILNVLNGGFWLKNGRLTIDRVYEQAENIYREFTIDPADNQYLMHPYAGFRFEGQLSITQPCKT